ncbi:Putative Ca2+/H+ antiporter, TMEM165/GDT1 family [Allopseudospirillum japonicum]|uniref:GDT1 family protein n=1 Tax=Allopseudospirillum japonicum TaxID=64971 RepID=A0A1H6Q6A0_9GAMM|nr:TMEM165/GDT1 family protein [Allopseudospirillum japonicum]SEI39341.1 Putative Ca2+/H+ antiporter, TMEM165/GDT1 family [Allopseudospirillum japonicum]
MEALLISTFSVAIAEIGDKTQLLSFLLIARFRQPWPIIWGILVATLANHAVAAWLGQSFANLLTADWLPWVVGAAFIAVGLWVLIPDKLDEEEESSWFKSNAFVASLVLFFIAEIGDKTQIATIILGAQYTSLLMVVMGTTLGMLAANVPVVMMGHLAVDKLPLDWIRRVASAVFILLGIYVIIMGLPQASA